MQGIFFNLLILIIFFTWHVHCTVIGNNNSPQCNNSNQGTGPIKRNGQQEQESNNKQKNK